MVSEYKLFFGNPADKYYVGTRTSNKTAVDLSEVMFEGANRM
jgi:hypothetical protein